MMSMAGSQPVEPGGIGRQGKQDTGTKRDIDKVKHGKPPVEAPAVRLTGIRFPYGMRQQRIRIS